MEARKMQMSAPHAEHERVGRSQPDLETCRRQNRPTCDGRAHASAVSVRRISVGIDEETSFGVVMRLLGRNEENFKSITRESGAKVILNGRGSPHPQPSSLAQNSLTICIRAPSARNLEEAVALVEDLLNDIRKEYDEF